MKKEYDFSRGRRGAVLGAPPGKTRITIRIDDDILQWFRAQVHKAGGGSYQTAMNEALRRAMDVSEGHVEGSLRRVLREELRAYRVRPKGGRARRKIRRGDRDSGGGSRTPHADHPHLGQAPF